MTDTSWHPDLTHFPGPKYLALSRALREAVSRGELAEGAQLPTVRDLAWRIKVTPGTVARAYQLATQEGLLAATVGRGTFVAARQSRLGPLQPLLIERDPLPGRADLRAPILPDVGQTAAIAESLQRIAGRIGASWLDYPSQSAELPLRRAVCDWMGDRVLGSFGPEDVALALGGQNALSLILQGCLRGDRPVVLTEELAYPGFRHAARLARAEVVPVETDAEGLIPEALEQACQRHRAQVICLTAEAQNPTAARMPPERRAQIVQIARRHDLQIIDDDCYAMAGSTWPSMRALAPERAWHVGSLSKTISASLRFGYIICPAGRGAACRMVAQHSFFALPVPLTELCQDLFSTGQADVLRQRVQAELEVRLQATVNALGAFDLAWQPGLHYVFLRLPQGWRASSFARQAEAVGVLLRSADEYALVGGRAPNAVRIAMAGNLPRAEFEAALAKLAALLASPPSELSV